MEGNEEKSFIKCLNELINKLGFKNATFEEYKTFQKSCCSVFVGIVERLDRIKIEGIKRKPLLIEDHRHNSVLLCSYILKFWPHVEDIDEKLSEKLIKGELRETNEMLIVCVERFNLLNEFSESNSQNETNFSETETSLLETEELKRKEFFKKYSERLERAREFRLEQEKTRLLRSERLRRENRIERLKNVLQKRRKGVKKSLRLAKKLRDKEELNQIKTWNLKEEAAREKFLSDQIDVYTEEVLSSTLSQKALKTLISKLNEFQMDILKKRDDDEKTNF